MVQALHMPLKNALWHEITSLETSYVHCPSGATEQAGHVLQHVPQNDCADPLGHIWGCTAIL
jgi:hypothetical protein